MARPAAKLDEVVASAATVSVFSFSSEGGGESDASSISFEPSLIAESVAATGGMCSSPSAQLNEAADDALRVA